MNDKLESIKVNSISESLSTFIEQGTELVLDVFTSDEISEIWDTVAGISAELVKASKIIAVIRTVSSIPDKLFMNKFEKYCRGLINIPVSKRAKYAARVGKPGLNKDSVFILGVLNKIEELSKIEFMLCLLDAKMGEEIDEETYRRLMLLVDRTMYSDLCYLKANITDEPIVIENDAEQGLLANGWLCYDGQTIGTASIESQFIYTYTNVAKRFCEITDRKVGIMNNY